YETALVKFSRFLTANRYPQDVTELGHHEIRAYIAYLQQANTFEQHPYTKPQEKQLSGYAINCYLRALRAFWSWLVREEIIVSNPFNKVILPKPPKKVIATFSEAQIQAMLKKVDTVTPAGFRDWTIIVMLLDSGLRASELTGLPMSDVNLEEGLVKVRGKGDKERMVPIGTKVQKAIWKYVHRYRPAAQNRLHPTLFLTKSGGSISVNRLQAIVEVYAEKAGITGVRCSPHTFRHTFAINYLRNGGDVFSLQRILGHSSLEIVRMYVNLAEADIKECHRKFSPADNMNIR
ncbi:tyrosine-type recombinase/integrase, partial [Chloroflexota bacterium]